jgi:hypothetical protein
VTRVFGIGVAGDGDVVGLGAQAVDLDCGGGVAGEGGDDTRALAGGRFVAQLRAARERRSGRGGWDAVVDDVDHAADGGAAVEQRRRTAQYLDALDQEGFDTDAVIGADAGGVKRAYAVVEHANAFAAEAADDRATGAGAEVSAADAGGIGESGAKGGRGAATEFVSGENGSALGQIEGGFAIEPSGHEISVERMNVGVIRTFLGVDQGQRAEERKRERTKK